MLDVKRNINLRDYNTLNVEDIKWRENSSLRLIRERLKQEIYNQVISSLGDIKGYSKYLNRVDKLIEDSAIYMELNKFVSKTHIVEYDDDKIYYTFDITDKLNELITIDKDLKDEMANSFLFIPVNTTTLLEVFRIIAKGIFDRYSWYTINLNDLFMNKGSSAELYDKIDRTISLKYVMNQMTAISDTILETSRKYEENNDSEDEVNNNDN